MAGSPINLVFTYPAMGGSRGPNVRTLILDPTVILGRRGILKRGGYVYMLGTQTGRYSPAHLALSAEENIEHKDLYEFWNSAQSRWMVGDEDQATAIIDDKVGELSVIYNQDHQKWFIAYFSADWYNITMRTANQITGPWSEPYELAAGTEYNQL